VSQTLHILLLVTVALCWSAPARACKCSPRSPAEAAQAASDIFEGRVQTLSATTAEDPNVPAPMLVELAVVRRFKGADAERLQVRTRADGAACGYAFERDKSYLVYAHQDGGALWVDSCSRTAPIANADEDLAALGMGSTPVDVKNPAPEPAKPEAAAAADCAAGGAAGDTGSAWLALLAATALAARRVRRS